MHKMQAHNFSERNSEGDVYTRAIPSSNGSIGFSELIEIRADYHKESHLIDRIAKHVFYTYFCLYYGRLLSTVNFLIIST